MVRKFSLIKNKTTFIKNKPTVKNLREKIHYVKEGDAVNNPGTNEKRKKTFYAFFDAEYTCYMENDTFFNREHSGEVLSVGVVITDSKFNLMKTYYSPIHPIYNRQLTGYCKKLTGLSQKEIDQAPSYEEVFQKLYLLFQEYPVKEIYTWGNDIHTLLHDVEKNHKFVSRKYKKIILLLKDLTKRLTRKVFGKSMSLSLSDMKYICDMEHTTAHNALEDAMDLYKITRCCVLGKCNTRKKENLLAYIQKRDTYNQYRRFKKSFPGMEILSGEMEKPKEDHEGKQIINVDSSEKKQNQAISLQYIQMVKRAYEDKGKAVPMEVLALCDDVLSLVGMAPQERPELEE